MIPVLIALLKVLVPFSVLSFIQNMAFTASSRSRNSGDPNYHRWCAYMSNGVYYITNALLTVYIIKYGALWQLAVQGIAYTLSTAEGSVLMMKKMIEKEKGKRAVGKFTDEEATMIRTRALFVDTGDGLGTFTSDELTKIKELIGSKVETVEEIVTVALPGNGDFEGYSITPGQSPVAMASGAYASPAWQPADITAIPAPKPGQGAKL